MLIDTHAHLFVSQFASDRDLMVSRAKEAGVEKVFLPNIDEKSIDPMLKLSNSYPDWCFPTMGLHPCSVDENFTAVLDRMESFFESTDMFAVGETGIDLYWDDTTKDLQLASFRRHIQWAKDFGLPIIIHSRNALDITISEISKAQDGSLKGVFHCFTGELQDVEKIRDLGFAMGVGGVVTFRNGGLDKVLKRVGLEGMVLETDSPYLAPVPYRGKRNEAGYVKIIAEKVSEILELSFEEVCRKTTENALTVFE